MMAVCYQDLVAPLSGVSRRWSPVAMPPSARRSAGEDSPHEAIRRPRRLATAESQLANRPAHPAVACEGLGVVLGDKVAEQAPQLLLVEHHHVIQQLSAGAAQPSSRDSVLPRASARRPLRLDAKVLDGFWAYVASGWHGQARRSSAPGDFGARRRSLEPNPGRVVVFWDQRADASRAGQPLLAVERPVLRAAARRPPVGAHSRRGRECPFLLANSSQGQKLRYVASPQRRRLSESGPSRG